MDGGNKLFIFGVGYTATRAAKAFHAKGFAIAGTVRTQDSAAQLIQQLPAVFSPSNTFVFDGTQWGDQETSAEQALAGTTHLLISVPTGRTDETADPVLASLREQLFASVRGTVQWVGYLSTIGVYGETNGVAVDESAPVQSTVRRSQLRIMAERQWLDSGLPAHVFRIAGIYGPGRGTITKVRSGSATRIHIPGRMFNRIHVDDIVLILLASVARPNSGGIYNVCDNEPAPADEVTAYACELLGVPVPPSQTWEEAEQNMSAMAKTFYAESKICSNERIKRELGVELKYPTYREGLLAQVIEEEEIEAHAAEHTTEQSASQQKNQLVIAVNIGSLRPEPYLDLRQMSFRLSRALQRPVVPCSFRFSNRIDASRLHGLPAKSFEMVLLEFLNVHARDESKTPVEIVVLPLFFGISTTLTEFLPDVLHKCWDKMQESIHFSLSVRLGSCLIDLSAPEDDRIAQILRQNVDTVRATLSEAQQDSVSVLVLDHGTPNRLVHESRELVAKQLRAMIGKYVKMVGTACMERRDGPEYDFNDPLLDAALDHYKITSGVVIIALLFLSNGRHAGEKGDIEEIVDGVKLQCPGVDVIVTDPIGAHPLVTEILHDRFRQVLKKPTTEYTLEVKQ